MHSVRDKLKFFSQFLRNPKMIGSVIPTSDSAIATMLSRVDWAQTRLFVEYGPGMGTFTRPILAQLRADARLVVIDTCPSFVAHLRASIDDPRLRVVHGSAADVETILGTRTGGDRADYVLSGLPLSTLPAGVAEQIAESTARALRPGGSFLVYQYSRWFLRLLDPWFARVDHRWVWPNIPPCVIAEARTEEDALAGEVQAAGNLVIEHPDKKVA
jgi:phospholipid N-methyltransferase